MSQELSLVHNTLIEISIAHHRKVQIWRGGASIPVNGRKAMGHQAPNVL